MAPCPRPNGPAARRRGGVHRDRTGALGTNGGRAEEHTVPCPRPRHYLTRSTTLPVTDSTCVSQPRKESFGSPLHESVPGPPSSVSLESRSRALSVSLPGPPFKTSLSDPYCSARRVSLPPLPDMLSASPLPRRSRSLSAPFVPLQGVAVHALLIAKAAGAAIAASSPATASTTNTLRICSPLRRAG